MMECIEILMMLCSEQQIELFNKQFNCTIYWLQLGMCNISCINNTNEGAIDENYTESICALLKSVSSYLGYATLNNITTTPSEDESFGLTEYSDDFLIEDDESAIDESDDETISNKICTFSTTQKDFMNQHWYYCYTCKMFDGIGVCSVCAKVCHKNHDVVYAKFGNFFCDCGAKEDGSCIALTRRYAPSAYNPRAADYIFSSYNLNKIPCADEPIMTKNIEVEDASFNKNDTCANKRINEIRRDNLFLFFTCALMDIKSKLVLSFVKSSSYNCYFRAREALHDLHTLEKRYEFAEDLVVACVGPQVNVLHYYYIHTFHVCEVCPCAFFQDSKHRSIQFFKIFGRL